MLRTGVILAITLLSSAPASGQISDQELELRRIELGIQREIADWTFWMVITSTASAVFASLSVLGLIWTFREQRKLTHAQERAFLDTVGAELKLDSIVRGHIVSVSMRNTGRTHAFNVAGVAMAYSSEDTFDAIHDRDQNLLPKADRARKLFDLKPILRDKFSSVEELAPNEVAVLEAELGSAPPDFLREMKSGFLGGDLICVVSYTDIYGRRHFMELTGDLRIESDAGPNKINISRSSRMAPYSRRLI